MIDTLVVFASGVALLLVGPSSRESLLPVHKVSFIVWLALTSLHVLGHLPELARGLVTARETRVAVFAATGAGGASAPAAGEQPHGPGLGRWAPAPRLPGTSGRALALTLGLLAGVALAVALIPDYAPWIAHGAHH